MKVLSASPLLLLGGTGVLLAVGAAWNPAAPACVAAAGALITIGAARGDRFLLGTAIVAFGLRALLAVVLHVLAVVEPPGLAALLTEPLLGYRFWIVAPDAMWYHGRAIEANAAWTEGTSFPTGSSKEHVVFIALVYLVFGPNPLTAVLCNALFGSLSVVTGHRIAARVAGPAAARAAALLIALWPSMLVWSSQLLKDTLSVWLILGLLYVTMRATDPLEPGAPRWRELTRWAGRLTVVFVAAVALYELRHYVLLVMLAASFVFIAHGLVRRPRTPWRILAACLVVVVTYAGLSAGRRIHLDRIFAPLHPEIAHVNRGVDLERRAHLDVATWHYERALDRVPHYPPALRRLGAIAVARDDRGAAITYLDKYVSQVPRDDSARAALAALRSPTSALVDVQMLLGPPAVLPFPGRPAIENTAPLIGAPRGHGSRFSSWARDPLGAIRDMRAAFARAGGHSVVDTDVELGGVRDVVTYLPRALANAVLAPYPWQWIDARGASGPFRAFAAVEMLLIYVLIVPLLVGALRAVLRGSADAAYLLVYVVAMTALLGLVVINVGTLFRLRLEVLVPLFAAGSPGGQWLGSWAGLPDHRAATTHDGPAGRR